MSDSDQCLDEFAGMDFDVSPGDVHEVAHELEEYHVFDVEGADTETLAEWVEALKRIEDIVEEARKEAFEAELTNRVEDGGEVGNLVKRSGSHRYVLNSEDAIQAIEDAGGDPMAAMSLKANRVVEVLNSLGHDASELIGEKTYSYFARR